MPNLGTRSDATVTAESASAAGAKPFPANSAIDGGIACHPRNRYDSGVALLVAPALRHAMPLAEPLTRLKDVQMKSAIAVAFTGLTAWSAMTLSSGAQPAPESKIFEFPMVVSGGASTCLAKASARVTIHSLGPVETMHVLVTGLPPKTDFDFFVIQVPKSPFGMSWYQGDLETDQYGNGHGTFVGRFSIETFVVAQGPAPAPVVFNGPFPDASLNPSTNPIQMYHLGLWFNNPADAQKAGCPATVTPFNGEHNAGIQVLNTSNFPDAFGPLRNVH